MAKGNAPISTWDHWVSRLRITKCDFRMHRRSGDERPFIFIRQLEGSKRIKEFSSKD